VLKVSDGLTLLGSNNMLELRDHARLQLDSTMGIYGGTFTFDGAKVSGTGPIRINEGTIRALTPDDPAAPPPTLRQNITLGYNGHFASDPGTSLVLTGKIDGAGSELFADGGTVALMHRGNRFDTATINHATLEIGANGAGGVGIIRFLPSAEGALQVDAGVALGNVVQNFDAGATIDLPGIAFGPDTMLDLVPDPAGEKLTLSDGAHSQSVLLAGTHVAGGFHLQADGTGGTAITYAAPAALEGWSGG
jgi:hypothetical protein